VEEENRASFHHLQKKILLVASFMFLQVSEMSEDCLSLIKERDRVLRRMVEIFRFPIAFHSVYPIF